MPITAGYLVAVIIMTLWLRKGLTIITCILSVLALAPLIMPNIALSNSAQIDANTTVKIATFSAMTRTRNLADIKTFIQQHNPDILCLQEIAAHDMRMLVDQLDNHYNYHQTNNANLTIFSHFPMTLRSDVGAYQHASINTHQHGEISVFNVHMSRPYRTPNTLAKDWQNLLQQIDQDSPTILCGDFNLSPYNSLYDRIVYHYGYTDALQTGYGFTYPNAQRRSALFGPLIRIDYLFSKKLTPLQTRTLDISRLSDHRAVISSYGTPQQ